MKIPNIVVITNIVINHTLQMKIPKIVVITNIVINHTLMIGPPFKIQHGL
jgi:hypothetical protein